MGVSKLLPIHLCSSSCRCFRFRRKKVVGLYVLSGACFLLGLYCVLLRSNSMSLVWVLDDSINGDDMRGSEKVLGEKHLDISPLTASPFVRRLRDAAKNQSDPDSARMLDRRLRIVDTCRRYNLGRYQVDHSPRPKFRHPPTPQYEAFYFDRKHHLAYCPIYKAGSSSWLVKLALLNNITLTEMRDSARQLSEIARKVLPSIGGQDAIQAMSDSLRFLVVRHPFDRVLSAYRDKLESRYSGLRHGTEHFYQAYGRKIVQTYRKNPARQLELRGREEPTFPEFVQYLIDTDLVLHSDDHWIPYYLFCTPCWVSYDVVAHFETLTQDYEYLKRVTAGTMDGNRVEVDERNGVLADRQRHLTHGVPTSDVRDAYFAQITKEQVLQLRKKYELDFQLFGYSHAHYFDIAL